MVPPGDKHDIFIEWAKRQGISMNGIKPSKIPERGLGIVAQRPIKAREVLVHVPLSVLLTTDSVPDAFKEDHKGITVHGLLASFLATHKTLLNEWRATWPSTKDFAISMPICWRPLPEGRRQFDKPVSESTMILPPGITGVWAKANLTSETQEESIVSSLLFKQEERYQKDWANISSKSRPMSSKEYMYYWLIVNTRCFYYNLPTRQKPQTRDDHMALCPFIDYFNHANVGCMVRFADDGFSVIADRDYEVGEELYVSYGPHSNDFLFAEYGFILKENKWDTLKIDALLLSFFDSRARQNLDQAGYLGNYVLCRDGVCYRTQVAVREAVLSHQDWTMFIEGNENAMQESQHEMKADDLICQKILVPYHNEATQMLELLGKAALEGKIEPQEILVVMHRRWKQIQLLIEDAFNFGINPGTQVKFRHLLL